MKKPMIHFFYEAIKSVFQPRPVLRDVTGLISIGIVLSSMLLINLVDPSYKDPEWVKYYEPHFLPNGHIVALRNSNKRERGGMYVATLRDYFSILRSPTAETVGVCREIKA